MRRKAPRISAPMADQLLGILTSFEVPHSAFDDFPLPREIAEQIPEVVRPLAIKYQRDIAYAVIRYRNEHAEKPSIDG